MANAAQERLWFIEASLTWRGFITRKLLMETFGLSESKASTDLREYQTLCAARGAKNMEYDTSAMQYIRRDDSFLPIFGNKSLEEAIRLGVQLPYEKLEVLPHSENQEILQTVLQACTRKILLSIEYFSGERGEIETRPIYPHHVYFDGLTHMVRAFCPKRAEFRTFSLRRIRAASLDPQFNRPHDADPVHDRDWNEHETIEIEPAPTAKNPEAIAQEFQMHNKSTKLEPRRCQADLVRRRLGLLPYGVKYFQEKA